MVAAAWLKIAEDPQIRFGTGKNLVTHSKVKAIYRPTETSVRPQKLQARFLLPTLLSHFKFETKLNGVIAPQAIVE